jgi:Zn-dependent protease with chaperone function
MGPERLISSSCQQCAQPIEFSSADLGLAAECPHCGQVTNLREETAASAKPAEILSAGELKAAFDGTIPRSRISLWYQLGLGLVAGFMILLPVLYLALIVLAAWGVYWYAVHAKVILTSFSGGVYVFLFKLVIYFGPIFGGVVAVMFMFKPLFARPAKRPESLTLNPALDPRLFQFIAHLTDLLSAPMPKRIDLDCELNASASFRRGWISFLGSDLVLTIGLPLVAGLNTRQLAAVVAHELGHFTQGAGMRLGFVINRINLWFVRVVYQRDSWDEALDEWSNSAEDSRLALIVACAHLAVWFSRLILKTIMLFGHATSCFLSRQMEFHADSRAIAVVGSQGFESTLIRMREQVVLEEIALGELNELWKKRHQLPDSIPDFLSRLEQKMPASFQEQALNTLLNESAGLWATHPTAAQRIQKARRQDAPGIFQIELPSTVLFGNFAETAKSVTRKHYRQNLRLAVTPAMLKPTEAFFRDASS